MSGTQKPSQSEGVLKCALIVHNTQTKCWQSVPLDIDLLSNGMANGILLLA